jgi:PAS domain S-box-containing protein
MMSKVQLQSKKIYWYLIVVMFLFSAGIGTGGYFFFEHQKRKLKEKDWEQLAAIADLKVGQIMNWRRERIGDGSIIMETPFIHHHVQQLLSGPASNVDKQAFLDWMSLWQRTYSYKSIFLLDTMGRVRLSLPEGEGLSDPYSRALALEAMRGKKVLLSDLHRSETAQKIHIDLCVPLLGAGGPKNLPLGVLLLEIDPYQFLYPLIQSWPTPSRSSESLLIRLEGAEALFLNEARFQKNTALNLRLPINEQRIGNALGAHGQEGIVESHDYRGVAVLAALRRIPDSPWFLVAKLDQDEIYGPIHQQAWYIGILVGILITGAGLSVGLLWRHQRALAQRRQYEGELERRALAQHYDYLSRYANDIILLMDEDLRIIEANDRATECYGHTHQELLGMNIEELGPPEAGSPLVEQRNKLDGWGGVIFEILQRRKDGTTFYAESSSRVIQVEGKRFYQSILRDITERKQAEEALADRTLQLERINRELAALNAQLDDFTHMASHDLQEPLRTLIAFSNLLHKDLGNLLPERAAKYLAFIADAAKRMQALIQDLLALSRAGRAAQKKEKVSLRECADLALENLAMRVKETGAQVIYDPLPDAWGDATLLTQLYQNLIGNALKFSGDQRPTIQLTFEEQEGTQVFGVKDTGIGIEPKYAREIFKPFRRLHGRDEYEGSGVGLAICGKIVERHGGEIWVESEPGKGAHFRFTLSHRVKER